MLKVAINGMGRIGRAIFKILQNQEDLDLVAVNDLVSVDNLAYLLKYDSVYGPYELPVEANDGELRVGGRAIKVFSEKDPAQLPWNDLGVDLVFECTGLFLKKEDAQKHIDAGAGMAILSAPSKSDDIPTIVFGANYPKNGSRIISCASCTTNCITPVIEIVGRRIGIRKAIMTTVHAYTSSQALIDKPNKRLRRGRAAAVSLVPSTTGAAKATIRALPQYKDKFDGTAIRCPIPVGSISDITIVVSKYTSASEINDIFREEAAYDQYRGIIAVNEDEIVSSDIVKNPHASIVDLTMTQVVDGDLVKIMAWYDNEWGYSNQMVRTAAYIAKTEMALS